VASGGAGRRREAKEGGSGCGREVVVVLGGEEIVGDNMAVLFVGWEVGVGVREGGD
jgi:hypothetical protein